MAKCTLSEPARAHARRRTSIEMCTLHEAPPSLPSTSSAPSSLAHGPRLSLVLAGVGASVAELLLNAHELVVLGRALRAGPREEGREKRRHDAQHVSNRTDHVMLCGVFARVCACA
eukprot:3883802-Rhodomonas_salina.3